MSRRVLSYDEGQQAFHDGQITGETLAVALPHIQQAAQIIDQVRELADSRHLTGLARDEFIKGSGYGFADKRYCQPAQSS